DLPAPFSPTSAWTSPPRSSKRASLSACTPGKSLLIPSISTSGALTASGKTRPPRDWRGPSPVGDSPAPVSSLLVQQCRDVRAVDVRLVVVLEAGVDVL